MSRKPLFHILVGPNGAGKSSFYETMLKPWWPRAAFINADLLARDYYGRAATTREESETGQRLAQQRRRELITLRHDLITESTFSHPSKLDLLRAAKEAGYDLRVYHINLSSPELAVKRVARRVDEGGHPVPEEKIKARYQRNQALIHQAVLAADRAYVIDNSVFGEPHQCILEWVNGKIIRVNLPLPAWVEHLYASQIKQHKACPNGRKHLG